MSDTYKILPLDAWHRAKGARMVSFAGYSMPIQYEGIMAEHLWTRESAGLFDVSHMGQIILSGEGVDGALEKLIPSDVSALREGRQRYSLLLNEAGGILDDLMIARTPMGLYLVVNGAVKWNDIAHLRKNLPPHISLNHLEDRALLALQGPKAVDVLARLIPSVAGLSFMAAGSFLWMYGVEPQPLWISRSGYTGEDGFEISVPAEVVEALTNALCDQPEVKPIGLGARDSLRLEAGLPLYGHDLDEGVTPVSGSVAFAISKRRREEGGFAGAAIVLGQLADGAATNCVGFIVEGRQPVREGALIYAGDVHVGTITSGGFAPSVGAPIAMGHVASQHATPGTHLTAEVRGKRVSITVSPTPFIPHRYIRKGAK